MILDEHASAHRRRSVHEGDIVVLGGYGEVGQVVAGALAQRYAGRVVIAGRNLVRAQDVADSIPGARAIRANVQCYDEVQRAVEGASIVVMCLERANERVARASMAHGAHYIDISASTSVLGSIERLRDLATDRGVTAVLSVGVAPGLTNLLAKQAIQAVSDAHTIDISILAGLGERYGPDAVRWTVDQLSAPCLHGVTAARPERVRLPGFGLRTVHPLAFSDQYTLESTLGVRVTTRLCFDSAPLTAAIFALRSHGLLSIARRLRLDGLLTAAFARVHLGTNRFVVHVRASESGGSGVVYAATGRHASRVTGLVAAHVVHALHDDSLPAGVHHIEQLITPSDMFAQLANDEAIEFRHHRLY